MTIGEKIRAVRKNSKETQKLFAKRLGIYPETLSRYETDDRKPDLEFMQNFGSLFKLNGNWLLFDEMPVTRATRENQTIEGLLLELLNALDKQDGIKPSSANVTDISKDTLDNTPENLIPMIEYMLKDPEVCRDMLQFFYLFQKPAADKRLLSVKNLP